MSKYQEDVEKIFQQDIREKKRTGSGAFHMRGKGVRHGFNGALRTPYHFMKTKEKNQLNSEVTTYNMYETILTKEEFDLKDTETQKLMLTRWRELYPNTKIMDEMGISNNAAFAKIVNGLGIQKKREWTRKPNNLLDEALNYAKGATTVAESNPKTNVPPIVSHETITQEIMNLVPTGLTLQFNGKYGAEQLIKMFTKLQLMLEDEENVFEVHLKVTETAEKKERKPEKEQSKQSEMELLYS